MRRTPAMTVTIHPSTSSNSSLHPHETAEDRITAKYLDSASVPAKTSAPVYSNRPQFPPDVRPVPLGSDGPIPLPVWSQTAPRDFVSYAMCFPFRDSGSPSAVETAKAHLRRSLARLAESRPEFAGHLRLSEDPEQTGWLLWHRSTSAVPSIRSTFDVIPAEFGLTYQQLRERGFPPAAFTHPRFALGINANPADPPGPVQQQQQPAAAATGASAGPAKQPTVPVLIVRTFFIDGGLLLLVHLHHAFGDGECMETVLQCLAAQTRGVEVRRPEGWALGSPDVVLQRAAPRRTVDDLARACPEYHCVAGKMVGPTQPVLQPGGPSMASVATDARVFVFSEARLSHLRDLLKIPANGAADGAACVRPSIYVCISALTWAHVALARYRAEGHDDGRPVRVDATLMNPLNWRSRMAAVEGPVKPQVTVAGYFGNATTKCLTTLPASKLLDAARRPGYNTKKKKKNNSNNSSSNSNSNGCGGNCSAAITAEDLADLRDVAAAIRASILAVGRDFVDARTQLYGTLGDYRNLGLADDPRTWHDIQVNTWRPFGGDAVFDIPGVAGPRKPESVRKAMVGGRCDYRNALIMPAPAGSSDHELFVSLPAVALDALCHDEGFMTWVDRVAG